MSAESKFKILVGIYLNGDSMDPDKLSVLLGVSPSSTKRKGDTRTLSNGRQVVAKSGQWALVAELDADAFDLPAMLSTLGANIRSSGPSLATLPGVDNGYVDVFVATTADVNAGATCEFELSEQSLDLLKSFGLPLRFTIAVSQPNGDNKKPRK